MIKIMAPPRGKDIYGDGSYLASRDHGQRKHNGVDIACLQGSGVFSLRLGRVTKIGFPYRIEDPERGHLRYVQVTDIEGYDARYFYINPRVQVDEIVGPNYVVGTVQSLQVPYPGIIDHIHFEVKKDGKFVDPLWYIEGGSKWAI